MAVRKKRNRVRGQRRRAKRTDFFKVYHCCFSFIYKGPELSTNEKRNAEVKEEIFREIGAIIYDILEDKKKGGVVLANYNFGPVPEVLCGPSIRQTGISIHENSAGILGGFRPPNYDELFPD